MACHDKGFLTVASCLGRVKAEQEYYKYPDPAISDLTSPMMDWSES
jgi:hypothetical protein